MELRWQLWNSDSDTREFLPHLLVKVNVLGAEDSAIGGGWSFQTGTEARERPNGGRMFKVS